MRDKLIESFWNYPAEGRDFLLQQTFMRIEKYDAFNTRPAEIKWPCIARATKPSHVMERTFGSIDTARNFAGEFQQLITDNQGLAILNGSLLTGYCGNPTMTYFRNPIDIGRVSDIDVALVDRELFSHLPQSHIIHKQGLAEEALLGNISHGFYDSVTFAPKKIMEKPVFKPLRQILEELFETTGRFIDFKIFNSRQVLKLSNRPFYVLADKSNIYF